MEPDQNTEIDGRALKFLVGLIALSLASVTSFLTEHQIQSISASYHEGGWSRDYFVGSLFAIAAFLFAYNGRIKLELYMSKVASFAALGVALFPCGCDDRAQIIPNVHYVSAGLMFITLAIFCWAFYARAIRRGHKEAVYRARIYLACGILIVASVCLLALDMIAGHPLSSRMDRFVFWMEATALVAFGVSWLVAGKVLPGLTNTQERYHIIDKSMNQPDKPAT